MEKSPEKFADAIFNFHMDRTDPESVDAAVRVHQYTGKSAPGLNVLAETYELPPTTLWRANQAFVKTLDLSSVPWPWKKEQVLSWAKLFVKHELPLELHKTGTGTHSRLFDSVWCVGFRSVVFLFISNSVCCLVSDRRCLHTILCFPHYRVCKMRLFNIKNYSLNNNTNNK